MTTANRYRRETGLQDRGAVVMVAAGRAWGRVSGDDLCNDERE